MPGQTGSELRRRNRSHKVRLSDEEFEQIRQSAAAAGVSVSHFLRAAALRREVRSKADVEAIADLSRLGGLLKWWLTDGEGKDGERHVRGRALGRDAQAAQEILDALKVQIRNLAS